MIALVTENPLPDRVEPDPPQASTPPPSPPGIPGPESAHPDAGNAAEDEVASPDAATPVGLQLTSLLSLPWEAAPEVVPPVRFPIAWILGSGSIALFRRALIEVAGYTGGAGHDPLDLLPYFSKGGWNVQMMQEIDGTWEAGMLSLPRGRSLTGVGTIPAYRRLLELGWDPETPGMAYVRRLFFRLLAVDEDPSLLFELGGPFGSGDEDTDAFNRSLLREAAAALLAAAGYTSDPRLRGIATRMLNRIDGFLSSPLASDAWIKSGGRDVLSPDAHPPSYHQLDMLAHMPGFRHERHGAFERVYGFLTQPWPDRPAAQLIGRYVVQRPQLVLGDPFPDRESADTDLISALAWLELMARLDFLNRNEAWSALFDSFVEECDENGVWAPARTAAQPRTLPVWSWHMQGLSDHRDRATSFALDVTFRIGLIARLAGREIELVSGSAAG